MFKTIFLSLFLVTGAYAAQQSCTATAKDCKDPVTNPQHYPAQHCTCFTCEKGTPGEKVLCTNDEKEAGKLQARVELPDSTEKKLNAQDPMLNAKTIVLTGWVKEQNGKTVFENDKDKQAWEIDNSDVVKGHKGHRVKVTAKLNEADHTLTVEKMSKLNEKREAADSKATKK